MPSGRCPEDAGRYSRAFRKPRLSPFGDVRIQKCGLEADAPRHLNGFGFTSARAWRSPRRRLHPSKPKGRGPVLAGYRPLALDEDETGALGRLPKLIAFALCNPFLAQRRDRLPRLLRRRPLRKLEHLVKHPAVGGQDLGHSVEVAMKLAFLAELFHDPPEQPVRVAWPLVVRALFLLMVAGQAAREPPATQ
jgi:hypothetical protein